MNFKIITFHRGVNYGAFLQAYSVQMLFGNTDGWESSIYDYQNIGYRNKEIQVFLIPKGGIFQKKFLYSNHRRKIIKYFLFKFFVWRYLKLSSSVESKDILVFGSDEIWNLNNWTGELDLTLFGVIHESNSKIAFAPSMGSTKDIPLGSEDIRRAIDSLRNFKKILVRDTNSKRLLEKVGLSSQLCLDPTMYVNWLENKHVKYYFHKIKLETKKFAVVNVSQVKLYEPFLNKLRDFLLKNGVDLICLTYTNQIDGLRSISYPNPFKWVSYFLAAEFVVTDTFHGAVFAINSSKPICLLDPGEKSTKISGLFAQIGLEFAPTSITQTVTELPKLIDTNSISVPVSIDLKREYQIIL